MCSEPCRLHGAFLPVTVTVGVDQYYLVKVPGAAARCLRVPTHPIATEPTVALSGATRCAAPVQAATTKTAASPARRVLAWLTLIPLLTVSGLLWWIIWIATRDAYRFLRRRSHGRIRPAAAFALCVAALLLGAWLLALPYWVEKQLRRAVAKLRQSQPV